MVLLKTWRPSLTSSCIYSIQTNCAIGVGRIARVVDSGKIDTSSMFRLTVVSDARL